MDDKGAAGRADAVDGSHVVDPTGKGSPPKSLISTLIEGVFENLDLGHANCNCILTVI